MRNKKYTSTMINKDIECQSRPDPIVKYSPYGNH